MFKAAEPPTHDDWVYRFVHHPRWRSFVKIALDRIQSICRTAAGYDTSLRILHEADGIPLGEFADALAALMPGHEGPGDSPHDETRNPSQTPETARAGQPRYR